MFCIFYFLPKLGLEIKLSILKNIIKKLKPNTEYLKSIDFSFGE